MYSSPVENRLSPAGREPAWETTVAVERRDNIHVGGGAGEDQFVATRRARDDGLPVPLRILPSVQVNIRAGRLPPKEANGVAYLKIPIDVL